MKIRNPPTPFSFRYGNSTIILDSFGVIVNMLNVSKSNQFWLAIDENGALFIFDHKPIIKPNSELKCWFNECDSHRFGYVYDLDIKWESEDEWKNIEPTFYRREMLEKLINKSFEGTKYE